MMYNLYSEQIRHRALSSIRINIWWDSAGRISAAWIGGDVLATAVYLICSLLATQQPLTFFSRHHHTVLISF